MFFHDAVLKVLVTKLMDSIWRSMVMFLKTENLLKRPKEYYLAEQVLIIFICRVQSLQSQQIAGIFDDFPDTL
jgi:hypothetical protein